MAPPESTTPQDLTVPSVDTTLPDPTSVMMVTTLPDLTSAMMATTLPDPTVPPKATTLPDPTVPSVDTASQDLTVVTVSQALTPLSEASMVLVPRVLLIRALPVSDKALSVLTSARPVVLISVDSVAMVAKNSILVEALAPPEVTLAHSMLLEASRVLAAESPTLSSRASEVKAPRSMASEAKDLRTLRVSEVRVPRNSRASEARVPRVDLRASRLELAALRASIVPEALTTAKTTATIPANLVSIDLSVDSTLSKSLTEMTALRDPVSETSVTLMVSRASTRKRLETKRTLVDLLVVVTSRLMPRLVALTVSTALTDRTSPRSASDPSAVRNTIRLPSTSLSSLSKSQIRPLRFLATRAHTSHPTATSSHLMPLSSPSRRSSLLTVMNSHPTLPPNPSRRSSLLTVMNSHLTLPPNPSRRSSHLTVMSSLPTVATSSLPTVASSPNTNAEPAAPTRPLSPRNRDPTAMRSHPMVVTNSPPTDVKATTECNDNVVMTYKIVKYGLNQPNKILIQV